MVLRQGKSGITAFKTELILYGNRESECGKLVMQLLDYLEGLVSSLI